MAAHQRDPRRSGGGAVAIALLLLTTILLAAPTPAEATGAPAGIVASWGENGLGQLGNGETTLSEVPVTATGPLAAQVPSALAAGESHTCAIAGGKPYCWGFNYRGQLGTTTPNTSSGVPVAVDTTGVLHGKTITAITAGGDHTCVVADARAYCWGFNGPYGALGNNSADTSFVPVAVDTTGVLNGKAITAINAATYTTCVIADAKPYCWGDNGYGQLGNDDDANMFVPVAVDTSGVLEGKSVTAISGRYSHTCVIADTKPYCWGRNTWGQLGDGSTDTRSVPVAVDADGPLDGKTVTAITTGYVHTCVIADGKPYCWGYNGTGELGNNSDADSQVPVAVDTTGVLDDKTTTAISGGDEHVCTIADARAYCWGLNDSGQVGDDTKTDRWVPVAVDTSTALQNRVIVEIAGAHGGSAALAMTDPGFCDVSTSASFFADIVWLSGVGITTGTGGCYKPAAAVSRQAMAAFLFRSVNPGEPDPVCSGTTRTFTDVPTSHPFCGPIEWLESEGITGGYPGGTFKPTGTVTRQAMAAFLFRALNPGRPDPTCAGSERTFTDVAADHAFCGPVEWLATTGITGGYSDGTYRPAGTVTRQAMAAFLHRALT